MDREASDSDDEISARLWRNLALLNPEAEPALPAAVVSEDEDSARFMRNLLLLNPQESESALPPAPTLPPPATVPDEVLAVAFALFLAAVDYKDQDDRPPEEARRIQEQEGQQEGYWMPVWVPVYVWVVPLPLPEDLFPPYDFNSSK